jgi:thiosulfate/3-mercaptopyruvate sulfurtransferase
MKKFFSSLVLALVLALPSFALSVPSTHLVSADWLAKNASNVVIVDLSKPKVYAKGHIPGAVNIPKKMFFMGYMGDIKHLLNTPAQVEKLFRNAGINNDSVVVFTAHVKKAKKFTDMTRGLWTAWVYGLKNVAILDGGIEAWSGKLSTAAATPAKGNFTPAKLSTTDVKTWRDIYSAMVNKDAQIVDAREMKHYVGKDKDKRLKRHGHIPGAKKVSAYLFAKKDGKVFKLVSPAEAKSMIAKAGISLDKPIITYCNTGHLATGTWFVAKFLAGAKNIGDYDASMYEYSRSAMPVAQGK